MDHQEHDRSFNDADSVPPQLAIMGSILLKHSVLICKDTGRCFEGNAVLPPIARRLLSVPFEEQRHTDMLLQFRSDVRGEGSRIADTGVIFVL